MKRTFFSFAFFLCILFICKAQNPQADSVLQVIKFAKHDTTRAISYMHLTEICELEEIPGFVKSTLTIADKALKDGLKDSIIVKLYIRSKATAVNNMGYYWEQKGDLNKALEGYKTSLTLAESIHDDNGIAIALNNIGNVHLSQGDSNKALDYFLKSLKIKEQMGDEFVMSTLYTNLGAIYDNQGNIEKALEFGSKALKLKEKINDQNGIAVALNNLGHLYSNQGQEEKSLEYYLKCLKIREKLGDKIDLSFALLQLGSYYIDQNKLDKAEDYFNKARIIQEELGHNTGLQSTYNDLAAVYDHKGDLIKSEEYFLKSLKISEEIGSKSNQALTLRNLGSNLSRQGKPDKALAYTLRSMAIAREIGYPSQIESAAEGLYNIYRIKGDFKQAVQNYILYIQMRDSTNNEITRKASMKNQLKYEYEKKEAIIKEQQEKERAIAQEKSLFQQVIIGVVIAGLLIVTLFAYFVFRSLKTTRHQKLIIEEKQMEILDSIHYAKRIQTALMANEKHIDKTLGRLITKHNNKFV